MQKNRGAALLEVIIAIGIVTLVMTTLVSLMTVSLKSASFSQAKTLGTKYSQEGMESVRQMRSVLGWDSFVATLQADGSSMTYCLSTVPQTAVQFTALTNSPCTTTQFVDAKSLFQRSAIISVTTIGSRTSVSVTITTTWNDSGISKQSTLSQQFEEYNLADAPVSVIFSPQPYSPPPSPVSSGWRYRQQVDLKVKSGPQTAFQAKIAVNTSALISAGKMQVGCQDVRVTDFSGVSLPYWIETGSNGCNTSSTLIWVKIPSLAPPIYTFYLYYGNSTAASIANGNQVFDFFDDFTNSSLNTVKWGATGAYSISNGELTISTGTVFSKFAVTASNLNQIFEDRAKWATPPVNYSGLHLSDTNSTDNSGNLKNLAMFVTNSSQSNDMKIFATTGTTSIYDIANNVTLYTPVANTYYINGIAYHSSGVRFSQNRGTPNSYTATINQYAPNLSLGFLFGANAGTFNITDMTIDFVLVRKYVVNEPTETFGSEQLGGWSGL